MWLGFGSVECADPSPKSQSNEMESHSSGSDEPALEKFTVSGNGPSVLSLLRTAVGGVCVPVLPQPVSVRLVLAVGLRLVAVSVALSGPAALGAYVTLTLHVLAFSTFVFLPEQLSALDVNDPEPDNVIARSANVPFELLNVNT